MESEEHDRGRRKRPRSLSRGGSGDEDDVPRSTEERGSRKSRTEDGRNYDRIEIIPSRQDSFPSDSGRRLEVGSKQDLARNMNDDERQRPYDENDNTWASQNPAGSFQPSFMNNQGSRGPRPGRGGRMIGSEAQRTGVSLPMINPSFGHPGLPPGSMQQMPNMQLVPPYGPGVLMTPFQGPPQAWPGSQGLEMNMLAMSQGILPIPHGPMGNMYSPMGTGPTSGPMGNIFSPMGTGPTSGPMGNMFSPMGTGQTSGPMGNMFSPMGTGPTPGMYFNQPGPGRGAPLNMSIPGYNSTGPNSHDKAPVGRGPQQRFLPAGRAPTRGEQNDYSQNFVDTGMRPQNFIRELEPTSVVEDYPKLRELIQKKDEIVTNSATLPMYYKCDLREHILTPEFFGTKFDVILVDPPWEEYVHRAPGVTDNMEHWTLEEIQNLQIEAIADTPSFIFLWVGDGVGLEQGRQCLKKWGFRRVEDICWVKTNKTSATPGLRHDSRTLFQHTKEHCLMGMKGTVRRNSDGHIIHANIDTDVMIAEEPEYGSTKKPEDMYRIIEHFALGRRRLELFGEDHNIRSGWLTLGKELSSSNFSAEAYTRNFADQNGKVWQGGGGRNPPPYTPHLVVTTPDIEELRPKSPPPKI